MSIFLKLSKNLSYLPNILNLFLILTSFVYLALRYPLLPPEIPLWQTLPWGKNQLSTPLYLWLLPFGMLTAYLLNTALGILVFKTGSFLTNLVSWQGLLVSILGIIALWRVVILTIP